MQKYQNQVNPDIGIGDGCAAIVTYLLAAQSMYVAYAGVYYYFKNNGSMCHTINIGQALLRQRRSSLLLLQHLQHCAQQLPTAIRATAGRQMTLLAYDNLLLHDYALFGDVSGDKIFPYGIPREARIVLYGAGSLGMQMQHYLAQNGVHIVLWCDRSYRKHQGAGLPVSPPAAIRDAAYDFIVLAIGQYELAAGAREELIAILGASVASKIRLIDPAELTDARLEHVARKLQVLVDSAM